MHTVSVIIPTHNRAELVVRAIKSVLGQTYSDLECIVVDDASTDDTAQQVRQINDSRLVYIRHEKNRHASAARNTGISKARGDFIAFLDDDDEWLPAKLEKQVSLLQSLPQSVGMVYCWMDYYDQSGTVVSKHHPVYKGAVFEHVLDVQRIGGCPTLLLRRDVIKKVEGFDETLLRGNDGDFTRRVCREYEVDYIPEALVKVYVGYGGDRISLNNRQGLLNAIHGKKTRLTKFKEDLPRYPQQHARILADIGELYSMLSEKKEAFTYYHQAFRISPFRPYLYRKIAAGILLSLPLLKKLINK